MNCRRFQRDIPASLAPFFEPALIEGENRRDYEALRTLLIEDVAPRSNIEWLWLLDLTELSWEILRYRKLKARMLSIYRAKAIEAALLHIDGAGGTSAASAMLQLRTKRNVADWQSDTIAAMEIESRLAAAGFDTVALNSEVIVQAQGPITLFDSLIHAALSRQRALLREISASRHLSQRLENFERQWCGGPAPCR